MKGIVITTSKYTKDWLHDCLKSIDTKYPVRLVCNDGFNPIDYLPEMKGNFVYTILDNNGFELSGIRIGSETFDEFVHLMDTCVIKDNSLFDKLFDIDGNVFLTNGSYHYMGKFVSLDIPPLPDISNKQDAIKHERTWLGNVDRTFFNPDLPVHTDKFEEKNGRRNMVLENDYLIKYKGTWSM